MIIIMNNKDEKYVVDSLHNKLYGKDGNYDAIRILFMIKMMKGMIKMLIIPMIMMTLMITTLQILPMTLSIMIVMSRALEYATLIMLNHYNKKDNYKADY